jgi:hypothetical protein
MFCIAMSLVHISDRDQRSCVKEVFARNRGSDRATGHDRVLPNAEVVKSHKFACHHHRKTTTLTGSLCLVNQTGSSTTNKASE